MRQWIEYAAAWAGLKLMGLLPRSAARWVGAGFAWMAYRLRPPLRRAARANLQIAFPEWSDKKRDEVLGRMIQQVGWLAGEFSQLRKYSRDNIEQYVVIDGFENFDAAKRLGQGVLFLTGHMSAWELSSFAHALYGYPLHFLVRPVSNRRVDALVNRYRCLSGKRPIDKNKSARAILKVLGEAGTVGILMDHNTSLDEGVFVNFFGAPASTSSGLARLALRTDAAVVPGFLIWDTARRKYRLRFEKAVELARTGDEEGDVIENTQRFTRVIEEHVRKYPAQWL